MTRTQKRIAEAAAAHGWTTTTHHYGDFARDDMLRGTCWVRVEYSRTGILVTGHRQDGTDITFADGPGKAARILDWLSQAS